MRDTILAGNLTLPSYESFLDVLGPEMTKLAAKLFQALWYNYLKDKGSISGTYWYDKFQSPSTFNTIIKSLSDAGWLVSHSIPARNWAELQLNEDKLLQYVSIDELEQVRAHNKFKKYMLKHEDSTLTVATRLNGKVCNTGLTRAGFAAAGNTQFTYDKHYMAEYSTVIQQNLTKSMDKIAEIYPELRHDRASYDTISIEVLDYLLQSNETFTRGNNYNDSRGRAISSSLGKIANPISVKDMRALLVMP